jgi:hypothetical protein
MWSGWFQCVLGLDLFGVVNCQRRRLPALFLLGLGVSRKTAPVQLISLVPALIERRRLQARY